MPVIPTPIENQKPTEVTERMNHTGPVSLHDLNAAFPNLKQKTTQFTT